MARDYAQNPRGWLLFQGSYGSGKTHLAAAIGNHRLALGETVMFVTVPDLLDHLRAAYAPSSEIEYDELFERVRTAPLLILDDFGAESPTPWAQEKMYQLVNHRYLHRLPTVLTTNTDLTLLDPRIRSRIVDSFLTQIVQMQLPDYRRSDNSREQSALSGLGIYGHMVFETFDFREDTLPPQERENLRKTFEIARTYAHNPQGWLLLIGEHGNGKTHLAAAIANYRNRLGETVMLVTAPDLLDHLRAAFNPSDGVPFDKRFEEIRTVPLLVIDQLDLSSATSWAREKLRQIIDHRYLTHMPTVFTTTQPLEEIDPLIRSRLSDTRQCQILSILASDYRGGAPGPRRPRR
jgi:DNA replication protein DnaC